MSTPQQFPSISELLRRQGIWLEKGKSQHFLKRQVVCSEIADLTEATGEHLVIEVGTGLGNLTVELAARAASVVSYEVDHTFAQWHDYLRATHANLEVVYRDFLEVDLAASLADEKRPLIGAGNLPYQITSAILFAFVECPRRFDRLVFMVQKEVAERICSGPATRASGALTYKIALLYHAELRMLVGAQEFLPPPKVESAVIVLEPLATPLVRDVTHRKRVFRLLDGIFQYRRKTLQNCLQMAGLVPSREAATAALGKAGVELNRRPETLTLDEVLALAEAIA